MQLFDRLRAAIILAGQTVTFDEVTARTSLGRATLYRNPDLRESSRTPRPGQRKHTSCQSHHPNQGFRMVARIQVSFISSVPC